MDHWIHRNVFTPSTMRPSDPLSSRKCPDYWEESWMKITHDCRDTRLSVAIYGGMADLSTCLSCAQTPQLTPSNTILINKETIQRECFFLFQFSQLVFLLLIFISDTGRLKSNKMMEIIYTFPLCCNQSISWSGPECEKCWVESLKNANQVFRGSLHRPIIINISWDILPWCCQLLAEIIIILIKLFSSWL